MYNKLSFQIYDLMRYTILLNGNEYEPIFDRIELVEVPKIIVLFIVQASLPFDAFCFFVIAPAL